jgi:hypothetical protein
MEVETNIAPTRLPSLQSTLNYGALIINAVFSSSAMIQFGRECWEDGWAPALLSLIGLG